MSQIEQEKNNFIKAKTLVNQEEHKEQKVDLINDVVSFVAELNEIRYSGDTLLQTLSRMLSKTFIDKYEYDASFK